MTRSPRRPRTAASTAPPAPPRPVRPLLGDGVRGQRGRAPRFEVRALLRAARGRSGRPPRVLVVTGSVGSGHDVAADEIARRLRARGVEVDVRDHLDALPRVLTPVLRGGYALLVGRLPRLAETLFTEIERRRSLQLVIDATCRLGRRRVLRWVRSSRAQLVVSTFPLASQTLGQLRASGRLRVPVVTYLTDPAAHRGWVHPSVDHHVAVTAWTAERTAAEYGVATLAVGPLVPERFSRRAAPDGAGGDGHRDPEALAVRAELGLAPDARVALIVAGSLGLGDVRTSAARTAAAGMVPLVLCGRSAALRRRVAAVPGAVALGWRDDVPVLLRAADVLVHNAGGMSCTEALVVGLPAVSYRCLPGHGRANAAALDAAGLVPWARDDDELGPALRRQAALRWCPSPEGDPADHLMALLGGACRPRTRRIVTELRRIVLPAAAATTAPTGSVPGAPAGSRRRAVAA